MSLKGIPYADWPEEKKKELLVKVQDLSKHLDKPVRNITVHGSYVYGTMNDKSDIDVVLWVELLGDFTHRLTVNEHEFEGIPLDITMRSWETRDVILSVEGVRLNVPYYSLLTGEYHEGSKEDVRRIVLYKEEVRKR